MILITSAAFVSPGLVSEFGKLPPSFLPVQNRRLFEHQISLIDHYLGSFKGTQILSLPKSYSVSAYDEALLKKLGVQSLYVPEGLSLGQSIVYVLNSTAHYDEPLFILHGDTLFTELVGEVDSYSVSTARDQYEWAAAGSVENKQVYSGLFSFSNQSLLIQKIVEAGYGFIKGVEAYAATKPMKAVELKGWMDFGLVNSYYRSSSQLTTQRVFNNMKMTRYSVRKSSKDGAKMRAEANWMLSLPSSMRHYAPAVYDHGEDFYEIEYYFLPTLANLFVYGELSPLVWEEIIGACHEYLNDESIVPAPNADTIARQNDKLYTDKTLERLNKYAEQNGISLEHPWRINGKDVPTLNEIVKELDSAMSKQDTRFATLMHGDPCFSNMLYDFKSKTIKLIDPRGINLDGNLSIYGDFRYDVGKLAHSIIGMYDFIIGGRCNYKANGDYDVELSFEDNPVVAQTQEFFLHQQFGGYSLDELSMYPVMIHLFLSMLPLHSDHPERQRAFLANALRLYVEYKKDKQ